MQPRVRLFFLGAFILAGFSLLGCSSMSLMKAELVLQSGNYQEAVTILRQYIAENPKTIRGRVTLGLAYLKQKKLDPAIQILKEAQQQRPGEARSTLFLGLAYIGKGQYEKAIVTWQAYKSKNAIIAAEVKRQLTLLRITYGRKMARRALMEEKKLRTIKSDKTTFAVCYYADLSPDNRLRAFRKALAAMVISDLAKVEGVHIVERIRLQALFVEMRLGQTGIVDRATAPRVGRLVGAENLVVGSLSSGSIVTNTALASTRLGKVLGDATITVDEEAFFLLPKTIAVSVLKMAGLKLTAQQSRLLGKDHTQRFGAAVAYGQALMALDRENWSEALYFFKEALRQDPQWPLAKEGYEACPPADSPPLVQLLAMKPLYMMNRYMEVMETAIRKQDAYNKPNTRDIREPSGSGRESTGVTVENDSDTSSRDLDDNNNNSGSSSTAGTPQ